MHVVIWEYRVHASNAARFEALYGPQGEWVALFRDRPGYLSTELLRGEEDRYLTIDRWHSQEAYEAFTFDQEAKHEYARIDVLGDALTLGERRIGSYTST